MMKSDDLFTFSPKNIVFYSKSWCPDCHRARRVFSDFNIPFLEIDIKNDRQAVEFVKQINNGNESVPTIVFPDGTYLVEPGRNTLIEKLNAYK